MEKKQIEETPMFGVFSWLTNIKDVIDNDALIEYAYHLQDTKPSINVSNRLGYHSPQISHVRGKGDSRYLPLVQEVVSFTRSIIEDRLYSDISNKQFGVESWVNINYPYAYNQPHIHGGDVLLSCVYYAKVPENSGEFYFQQPKILSDIISDKLIDKHPFFAVKRGINPKVGDLMVFPGWVEHGVEQNFSDEDRISYAFNVKVQIKDGNRKQN